MSNFFRLHGKVSITTWVATGLLALLSETAVAQSSIDTAGQPLTLSQIFGTRTDFTFGLLAGIDQRYMGARDERFEAVTTFAVSRGIFVLDSTRGAGIQYQSASGFYMSDLFNYDFGRTDDDEFFEPGSDKLKGMGNVKGTATNVIAVSQKVTSWLSVNAQAEFGLDGHKRGNQYLLGLEGTALQSVKDAIVVDFDVKIGDAHYNQTYFGVTPEQSANSGYGRYSPGAGIYAYSLASNWTHRLDKHWSTQVILGGTRYTNKVADSPIVSKNTGIAFFTEVNYAF